MKSMSRRELLGFAGAAVVAGISPLTFSRPTQAESSIGAGREAEDAKDRIASIEKAILFQNAMMDAYATGDTVRLIESYSDQGGLESTAFTYDNAVSIHAYLVHGGKDDLARAEVLGNGLIYAQATNFPFNDGRFAQGYFVNQEATDGSGAYITPAAFPFYFYTSAVGDQAWAGMALSQLYHRTGNVKYLTAALSVANWIVNNTYNTLGAGGYSFGTNINQFNESVPSPNGKSTEHNIDTFAFFTMLDELTHHGSAANGASWKSLAEHALTFLIAMYNATDGYFFTGTLGDQISINYYPVPEDVQTWSYLALLDNNYKQTIDWALANLEATDTAASTDSSLTGTESFTGLVFDSASLNTTAYDPYAVWLEGTSHTIAALTARAIAGGGGFGKRIENLQVAFTLVKTCESAQAELGVGQTINGKAITAGQGLVASTSPMDTGFGYGYFPNLHIGATGWYLIAAQGGNPFRLGYDSFRWNNR
ncbi:MAG: hypothetical protein ABSD67_11025 [Terracidiphilus sp.]|jgi:hypothetical protein